MTAEPNRFKTLLEKMEEPADAGGFEVIDEGRYWCRYPMAGSPKSYPPVTFELDYVRRERNALKGEVTARTTLPGARQSFNGVLGWSDLNLSADRTRKSFAKELGRRAGGNADKLDWEGAFEDFVIRVVEAERSGGPAVDLRSLPRPEHSREVFVSGFPLLARHPLILFGDGATAKSYLALWIAGSLAEEGWRVGYFDWELSGDEHRERLEKLFGEQMPEIQYVRCSRPLVHEADRLRRIARKHGLTFAVFDSVAFACAGPPESAEAAQVYFQSLRQLGPMGSLHLAHVSKALEHGDKKPFGSIFWANGARSTWNVQLSDPYGDDATIRVALHHRKVNLGRRRRSLGFALTFLPEQTTIRSFDLKDSPDLATGMPVGLRLMETLKSGPLSREQLREEMPDVVPNTLRQEILRAKKAGKLIEMGERLSLRSDREEANR